MTDEQLNAEVAVKVLGYIWHSEPENNVPDLWVNFKKGNDLPGDYDFLTWSGVGLIVEEMDKRGYYLRLEQLPEEYWQASFTPMTAAEDPEAPRAVALAAIRALEGKV
jgi:hypothetical protein